MTRIAGPSSEDVERLMKRCQIGVGGRNALNDAHDIMAACYGTLGALLAARNALAVWALDECTCWRCGKSAECAEGCTLEHDEPDAYAMMQDARATLFASDA